MKITLQELLSAAADYYLKHNRDNELVELLGVTDQWYDLLDTPLEDLHLSRLDLDGMEKDFVSINGSRI